MKLPWQQQRRQRAEAAPLRSSRSEQIRHLNSSTPLFLPLHDHVVHRVLPVVALTSLTLAAIYAVCHYAVAMASCKKKDQKKEDDRAKAGYFAWLLVTPTDNDIDDGSSPQDPVKRRQRQRQKVHKLCYQLTNLSVNAFLGLLGTYYQYRFVNSHADMKVVDTIVGHDHWAIFASVQIGYQLWSIPVGIWHVNESPAMLLHHFAVLMVASMSAFLVGGFRYWTPFFYGIIELSSVPLAVMNMFKDRTDWIQLYPQFYTAVRLLFCATFLTVRVVMFVPRKLVYLHDHYQLWFSAYQDDTRPLLYVVFMAAVWASSAFLLALQLRWGLLIVRGLLKLVGIGGGGESPSDHKKKKHKTSTQGVEGGGVALNGTNSSSNGSVPAPVKPKTN